MFYLTATIGITIPYGKIYWKKIKAIDNIELDTRNKLQKLKFLLWDGSLKSLHIFSKYINGIFETRKTLPPGGLSDYA